MSTIQNQLVGLTARHEHLQCQTGSASDYYGIGVRLGIYFAWSQAYIANTILPSEISSAIGTNTIFLMTLLIAMTNDSRTEQLGQLDALILMHLCGGTVFGILSLWGYRTRYYLDEGPKAIRHFGGFGTQIRLGASLGVSIFGLWFWLYGVTGSLTPMGPDDDVDPPNSPECATLFTFFFTKVRADGGIRIYYIIVCTCCIIGLGAMLLASTITGWYLLENIFGLAKHKRWVNTSRPKYRTGFNHNELKLIHKSLRVGNFLWLVFSALTVEYTLNFNHVKNVLGGNGSELHFPSQLLPFLVGVLGFLRTCYAVVEDRWMKEDTEYSAAVGNPSGSDNTPDEIGDQEKPKAWPTRYLVAWLPWLSLLRQYN